MTHLRDWVPLEGFADYAISPLGIVMRDDTKRILDIRINQYGVPWVGLMRDGVQHARSLPRLVATAFIPKPNKFHNTPINVDGDRTNCRYDNLLWRPRWYAVRYHRQFERRYEHPILEPVRVIGSNEVFENSWEAAIRFGLLEKEIVMSILNRTPAWPTMQEFETATMA